MRDSIPLFEWRQLHIKKKNKPQQTQPKLEEEHQVGKQQQWSQGFCVKQGKI